jgi:hypothetical protein
MTTAAFLKVIRLTHHYLGVFIAPAVLFFSFTGFLQMFSLHESTRGSSYVPPPIIVQLASIHKHAALLAPKPQAPKPPAPKPPPATDAPTHDAPSPDKPVVKAPPPGSFHWPLKIFFGLVAVGLFTSTLTGLYMAWRYNRRKLVVLATFVAGLVIPLLLLPF